MFKKIKTTLRWIDIRIDTINRRLDDIDARDREALISKRSEITYRRNLDLKNRDAREKALQMALEHSIPSEMPETVTARANEFFEFMTDSKASSDGTD